MQKNRTLGQILLDWTGLKAAKEERNEAAHRNMIIIVGGSVAVALFSGMITLCLLTGIHCPIDGFDEEIASDPERAKRYLGFFAVLTVIYVLIFFYALQYLRKKKCRPRSALVVAMLFSFFTVMVWGMAESGQPISDQLLIFASIQFLISGLIVFTPIASLIYFIFSFSMFSMMASFTTTLLEHSSGQIVYLALLDIIVSWIVYGLHRRSVGREKTIADQSRRDELTGAKNRHYLRDDVPTLLGSDFYVMFCDIDNFKHYNDTYSHEIGDNLLREFYFALREAFGDECTYRYGGDEFLVISPDFSEGEFQKKLEKCRTQLGQAGKDHTEMQGLTFSGGCIHSTIDDEATFRDMLHEADARLMESKRQGKNRVTGDEIGRRLAESGHKGRIIGDESLPSIS